VVIDGARGSGPRGRPHVPGFMGRASPERSELPRPSQGAAPVVSRLVEDA
jgi:hypothetical protein